MAIVCDFCPHKVDGKFSLAEAELSTTAISLSTATHPTIDKSSCDEHFQDMVLEALVGKAPGQWVTIRMMMVDSP